MSANRYFIDQWLAQGAVVELTAGESRHASLVMRRAIGSPATLVNGRGQIANAHVISDKKMRMQLKIEQVTQYGPPKNTLTLIQGTVRWEALCWIVEKATELGATHIGFASQKTTSISAARFLRLRNIAVAALKQSNGLFLPKIGPELLWNEWTFESTTQLFYADLTAHASKKQYGEVEANRALFVGPEGGFSEKERMLFRGLQAQCIQLGDNVLRSETAAICGLFMLNQQNSTGYSST